MCRFWMSCRRILIRAEWLNGCDFARVLKRLRPLVGGEAMSTQNIGHHLPLWSVVSKSICRSRRRLMVRFCGFASTITVIVNDFDTGATGMTHGGRRPASWATRVLPNWTNGTIGDIKVCFNILCDNDLHADRQLNFFPVIHSIVVLSSVPIPSKPLYIVQQSSMVDRGWYPPHFKWIVTTCNVSQWPNYSIPSEQRVVVSPHANRSMCYQTPLAGIRGRWSGAFGGHLSRTTPFPSRQRKSRQPISVTRTCARNTTPVVNPSLVMLHGWRSDICSSPTQD